MGLNDPGFTRGAGKQFYCPTCKMYSGTSNLQNKTGRKVCIKCHNYLMPGD